MRWTTLQLESRHVLHPSWHVTSCHFFSCALCLFYACSLLQKYYSEYNYVYIIFIIYFYILCPPICRFCDPCHDSNDSNDSTSGDACLPDRGKRKARIKKLKKLQANADHQNMNRINAYKWFINAMKWNASTQTMRKRVWARWSKSRNFLSAHLRRHVLLWFTDLFNESYDLESKLMNIS